MSFNPNYGIMQQGQGNMARAQAGLGQSLGQGISGLVQGYQQGQEKEQEREFNAMVNQALSGDADALAQVSEIDPSMGLKIQERQSAQMAGEQMELDKKAIDAMRLYMNTPDDQKDEVFARLEADPSLDVDMEDRELFDNPNEVRGLMTEVYGKEVAEAYLGVTPKPEEAMTEYQKEMIKGNEKNRELRKLELEQKKISNSLSQAKTQVEIDRLTNQNKQNIEKQEELKKQKVVSANSVIAAGESTLELINKIANHPGFESAIGAKGASSLFGLMDDPIAGTDAAGVAALIDTLDAQGFLAAVSNFKAAGGAGSLSDNEGKKLGASISNLKRSQSEKDFNESLKVVQGLVNKQIQSARISVDNDGFPVLKMIKANREEAAPRGGDQKPLTDEELIAKYTKQQD